jgi:inhibitor of KinA sporulation pathway (predicted exonuclease)
MQGWRMVGTLMNYLSIDLEMSQPSGKIIQIGAVVGDIYTGKVVDTFSRIVNPKEQLAPFIVELTGITQKQVDSGTSLIGAYRELVQFKEKHKARNQVIAWGEGDMRVLRQQLAFLKDSDEWVFGMRFFDTKTLFQSIMLGKRKSTKAGLAKALEQYGIPFQGQAHDAMFDALNTFVLFSKIAKQLGTLS